MSRASDRDDERTQEETKRLLYVALTRARDRLYLAGTITAGKVALQRIARQVCRQLFRS